MLALIAAVLATTPVQAPAPTSILEASTPWWERISVTVDDKGTQQACTYQSSLSPSGAEVCEEDMAASVQPRRLKAPSGLFSKLTFERRFSPGGKLDSGRLEAGDELLGQQVMFLTIDHDGSIASCRVVGTSGDMLPTYGCKQAQSEQFRAQASAATQTPRQAFMTIRVYGHQEQIA